MTKQTYTLEEAIEKVKKNSKEKFDASVEVHLKLGIDPKQGEQQLRGTVILPYGTGQTKKVAVFAAEEKAREAQEAGADLVGGQELIDEIKKNGKCDFEIAVAIPEMMKNLAQIAKILGPKGLMPSPKNETVTSNIKKTVEELKKGKIAFKNDDTANVHQVIGKISYETPKLIENYKVFLAAIKKAKPSSSKGTYIRNIALCSSMGKSVAITL